MCAGVAWGLMLLLRDKVTNQHSGFGFVEFQTELDAEYASKVMAGVKLHNKAIRINRANSQRKAAAASLDVGANLFVGSLSPEVDERMLYDTFSRFGVIVSTPKIMRDSESGESKGFAFVSFGDFESADAAVAALNGQYVAGRPISVAYAIKKDSKGERHGSEAERLLASQRRIQQSALNAAAMGAMPRPMMPMGFPGARPMMMGGSVAPVLQMPMMPPPPVHMQQQWRPQ
jgi:splicing factor 3B subunit 4